MEFSDAIRNLRVELGLTQMELANDLHVNYATISRWELGKTYPNRSMLSVLTEYARSHSASEECIGRLNEAIAKARIEKLNIVSSLSKVEHSSLGQLVDEASFPIYVCDIKTYELLYINDKAQESSGLTMDKLTGQKCYEALMHRDSPCPSCCKERLVHNKFTSFDVFRSDENAFYRIEGKLIQWNGRKAQVYYVSDTAMTDEIVETLLKTDYETLATINAETGEARKYTGGHLEEVIALQRKLNDNVAGVEAYLREHCIDDDVERVIKETSLPHVKEQLKTKKAFNVAYSLKHNEIIMHKRAVYTYLDDMHTTILCAIQDITELYNLESVKRDQIAAALQTLQEQGGMNVARYNLKTKTFYSNSAMATNQGYGEVIENVPEEFINKGLVAPVCIDDYRRFYDKLRAGENAFVTAACKVDDSFHWLRIDGKIIYDREGQPYEAIMSFKDIEEQREQDAVYKKWRQSLEHKKSNSYTLFRCNLSKGASFDRVEGNLLRIHFDPDLKTFNERTREYAGRFVHFDDFDAYTELLNSENLLAGYYRGIRHESMDYRERITEGEYRWIHLNVEMTQYSDSDDVEVFLMYEALHNDQIEDAAIKARINEDPLTGVLNRRAFIEQFTEFTESEQLQGQYAFILVDIDDFKRINENFGHAVGDQALVDIGKSIESLLQEDGILGRLGGDVFVVCLKSALTQAAVEQKALQIMGTLRKNFSVDIRVTASLGIAFYPKDGKDFTTLYHNADMALYTAKSNGSDTFAFFSGNSVEPKEKHGETQKHEKKKKINMRHMLLIDDNQEHIDLVEDMFGDKYNIEISSNEDNAISRLRRYGLSLSLILLSMDIKSVDSMALLDRIRGVGNVSSVPIITVIRAEDRELGLKSLRHGAGDFLLSPMDPELLKIRVNSAVSKFENERLRAQNTYLQTQNSEASQFRAVYENTDTVVVEYDWETHGFVYDDYISQHIFGKYDKRSLWQIFMSDMVADVQDVKAMQELIMVLANSHSRSNGTMDIMLKTPTNARHWFTMNAFKRVDDRNMPSKIILTFQDVNEDILASKKLHFQAEHDSLTGLYNRDAFLKLVEETVSKKPENSYVLLSCDINDFRFINERYGREEGDRLLQYTGEKLLVFANSMNSFAGRLSNDVYAVLLPNNSGVLEKATDIVQNFFNDYPLKTKITGRAGAYIISEPDMTADSMLDLAATASNTIKGRFASWLAVYDDSMNEQRLKEKNISDRMEAALADGQFDVYLQPQFHHATGQIVGAEALVRWIDPQQGVISPAEFIPVFEKNGFISKMDEYVWEKAAGYLSRWMATGSEPVPVSVNVSREDTKDPELCSKLLAIVEKHNIPIHLFRLEITESLFAEDTRRLIAVVEQLHEAGFLIEMDDFGSGYSSLNILKDVPVDILKLDMKFFSGTDNLDRGGMIIKGVLRMSRSLNMPVIAEGVELKGQADFLLSVGCSTIQGYLYEKPMPAHDFERMLALGGSDVIPVSINKGEDDESGFWNPISEDSQVFNNYIGPAAIFEYYKGEYEIVRINKRFAQIMRIKDFVKLPSCGFIKICEEDRPRLKKAVIEMIYSGNDAKVDIKCDIDGEVEHFYVVMHVIAKNTDRAMVFATLTGGLE